MSEFTDPLVLTSPHMTGQKVKDAQYLLNGNSFFKVDWLKSSVDGVWGLMSGQAADKARWELGYPSESCNTEVFGQPLYDFLRTDGNRTKLPPEYLERRKTRLAAAQSVKAKALAWSIAQVGTTEHPPGSNLQPYGAWYGLNGYAWCAIFFTMANVVGGGDKRVCVRGQRSAYAYWIEDAARAGLYGLRITSNPEPGDACVYHHNQGHLGRFVKWTDRANGLFQAVEGNTSAASDDNGGAVQIRDRNLTWARTVFVSLPS